jgi:rubrerythrin
MAVFSATQALEMAVRVEENGESYYRAAAERSGDPELKTVFEELAARERAHRAVFARMAEGFSPPAPLPEDQYGDYQSFLEVALEHAVFEGPDKALRLAEQANDRQAALRAAMGFEKDTMLFYYDLRELVGEADRDTITDIIREEKQHLRRLAALV